MTDICYWFKCEEDLTLTLLTHAICGPKNTAPYSNHLTFWGAGYVFQLHIRKALCTCSMQFYLKVMQIWYSGIEDS